LSESPTIHEPHHQRTKWLEVMAGEQMNLNDRGISTVILSHQAHYRILARRTSRKITVGIKATKEANPSSSPRQLIIASKGGFEDDKEVTSSNL
jgi:hypothetical protein